MLITFTINKPRQTLELQWEYLWKRGRNNKIFEVKKWMVILLLVTGLYLLLCFLSEANNFISLKGVGAVMIPLVWCALIIWYISLGLGRPGSKKRLKRFLDSITDAQLSYSVRIDEEKVVIASKEHVYELPWTEFNYFGIYKETLYVFNAVKTMNSLYWDQGEMGSEAYSALLELLQRKAIRQLFYQK